MSSHSHIKETKESIWQERLTRAEAFVGTDRAFCEAEGCTPFQLYYWRQKLLNRYSKAEKKKAPFIRVEVQAEAAPHSSAPPLPDPRWVADIIRHLYRECR